MMSTKTRFPNKFPFTGGALQGEEYHIPLVGTLFNLHDSSWGLFPLQPPHAIWLPAWTALSYSVTSMWQSGVCQHSPIPQAGATTDTMGRKDHLPGPWAPPAQVAKTTEWGAADRKGDSDTVLCRCVIRKERMG